MLTIRKAELKDYSDIKDLMLIALKEDPTAFSVSFEEYEPNSEYWWMGYINPFLIGNSQEMLLALEDNKLLGMIGTTYDSKQRKKHIASVVWFYVNKKYRNKGIGKQLLNGLDKLFKTKTEISKISLLVVASQEKAIRMYKHLGFESNGTLKNELRIDNKFYDVYIMERIIS